MKTDHTHNHDHRADAKVAKDSPIAPNTELEMILSWEKVKPKYEQTAKAMAGQVKLDGFRQGKVPASIALQHISPEKLIENTTEKVLQTEYAPFIEKSGKKPLGRPEFKIVEAEENKDWKVQVSIAEKPIIELKNIEKDLKQIKKDRVEDAKKRQKEQATADKKEDKPKLDAAASKQMEARKVAQEREHLLGFTYSRLIMALKPSVSELLVKQEAEQQLHNLSHQLSHFKLSFTDYLSQRGTTEEAFMQEVTTSALGRLQLAFVVDALIVHYNLMPTNEQVKKALAAETKEAKEYYDKNADSRFAYANKLAQERLEDFLLAD